MKNVLPLLILLLVLPFVGYGQKLQPRQLLHAKVVADSLVVDNLTVKNVTSNISAVTNADGKFTLYARATDTLYFSGLSFRSAYLIVNETHFLQEMLVIRLNVNVTVLDEVIITPNALTGDLAGDSRKTKTRNITAGMTSVHEDVNYNQYRTKYAKNENGALPTQAQGSQLTGVDFVRVYKMLFKKKKKKDRGDVYSINGAKSFPETVSALYTYHFFTQTLKIPKDEIGLFVTFCDTGAQSAALLDPKKEFELTDYLVTKSKEYLARKEK
jgi:hypothetical protein